MNSIPCPLASQCSGCSQWDIDFKIQTAQKQQTAKAGLDAYFISRPDTSEIKVLSPSPSAIRDRMDFVIEDGRIGLYSHSLNTTLDIPACPQLTPALAEFYSDFRKLNFNIKKGSFRLRVSPSGERGAWLDFANLDIKDLLQSKTELLALLKMSRVEIGQRRKSLHLVGNDLKLVDPVYFGWSETQYQEKSITLQSLIGGFTQAGHQANQNIIGELLKMTEDLRVQDFAEYGAGNGNLTFPILGRARSAYLMETDLQATEGLQQTAKNLGRNGDIHPYTANHDQLPWQNIDLLVANPPRSGLQKLVHTLQQLPHPRRPKNIFYMSCYFESLTADAKILQELGYGIINASIVDQFPQTAHFETLTLWKLI